MLVHLYKNKICAVIHPMAKADWYSHRKTNKLNGIKFRSSTYNDLIIPPNSIVYCDPPYQGTKRYSTSKDFNYPNFWQWCRDMTHNGHEVFISEYNAPEDFELIWSKEVTNSMNTTITTKPIEKLFKYGTNL